MRPCLRHPAGFGVRPCLGHPAGFNVRPYLRHPASLDSCETLPEIHVPSDVLHSFHQCLHELQTQVFTPRVANIHQQGSEHSPPLFVLPRTGVWKNPTTWPKIV